jgi:hypothetical protein
MTANVEAFKTKAHVIYGYENFLAVLIRRTSPKPLDRQSPPTCARQKDNIRRDGVTLGKPKDAGR